MYNNNSSTNQQNYDAKAANEVGLLTSLNKKLIK
jgi:hypothetical protein